MSMKPSFDNFLKTLSTKWQKKQGKKIFEADPKPGVPKFFCTFPYPYVNGSVHLGHGYSMIKVDLIARYKRMKGYNVLFPQGFHATGEPIVGLAKRLAEGDEIQKKTLKAFGVMDEDLPKFTDPEYIAKHFVKLMTIDMQRIGMSIDWRRSFVTTQITPTYSAFIEWQYNTLRELGFVNKGTHPVIWCPRDESPTGDHDRLIGDGVSITEFTLLKFPYKDAYLLPATLRPETTFGVTNMFLHPEASYIKVRVDSTENWIISEETLQKIRDQQHSVEVLEKIDPKLMMGEYCKNPLTGNEIIILPANFIDPTNGTGVVMSVPGHAPVDWVAINNLRENPEELKNFGISPEKINSLEPISLITVEGYGEYPAVEIVEEMGIKNQMDPRVEIATKTIYKKEFHMGVCKEITGKYAGTPVKEIKDILIRDFKEEGIAIELFETADKVVCRCGTRNHVKILAEQWFLTYSNPEWKEKTLKAMSRMTFLPEEARQSFEYTVNWLENKACARKSGLGTPLPWDPSWIVETLSDSTIYQVYYILSKYVNSGDITVENTTKELFDYIFQSKGSIEAVSQITGLSETLIEKIKAEFEYWMPMDVRSSGKDLIHNHLTFCLFQYNALFDFEKHQPKGMHVNGFLSFEGQKMSKSTGVLTPLSVAVEAYGADLTRAGLVGAGEGLSDAIFSEVDISSYLKRLETIFRFSQESNNSEKMAPIDKWLLSRLQNHIRVNNENIANFKTRSYLQRIIFSLVNDIKWYRRRNSSLGPAFRETMENCIKMLTPVTPYLCEEIWESWNKDGYVSLAPYPTPDDSKTDSLIEMEEEFLISVMEDIENIKKAMKIKEMKKIELFVADEWKYNILRQAMESKENLLARIMQDPIIRTKGKQASRYAQSLINTPRIEQKTSRDQELKILQASKSFLEKVFNTEIIIEEAQNYPDNPKAKLATPARVGINFVI